MRLKGTFFVVCPTCYPCAPCFIFKNDFFSLKRNHTQLATEHRSPSSRADEQRRKEKICIALSRSVSLLTFLCVRISCMPHLMNLYYSPLLSRGRRFYSLEQLFQCALGCISCIQFVVISRSLSFDYMACFSLPEPPIIFAPLVCIFKNIFF